MGRSPCCDKIGMKKGPWTPDEDILLVSYVQEHGAGNWKDVPSETGLKRCSKSCRLRWTNYLRPGIRRGRFTDQEEKMIIQLQALLGNKWAAIASYLPERTDNDIKNYWNTHLMKKLKKMENGGAGADRVPLNSQSICRGKWERRLQTDITTAKQALKEALSPEKNNPLHFPAYSYPSSTENIARLLQIWTKYNPKPEESSFSSNNPLAGDSSEQFESLIGFESFESSNSEESSAPLTVLEQMLLDDHGKDYLTNFSFDENPELLMELNSEKL